MEAASGDEPRNKLNKSNVPRPLNTTQKPGESGIKVKDMYVFVSGGHACGEWEIVQLKPVFHFESEM